MARKRLLLVHGWNWKNYTFQGCLDAWKDRQAFVDALRESFDVIPLNLPGFGSVPDPKVPWGLDDWSNYLARVIKKTDPDGVLGYSFGGSVVLHWAFMAQNHSLKTILVSPAIIRRYCIPKLKTSRINKFIPKFLTPLLRNIYLTYIVRNPFYGKATPVMKESYRKIVGVDLCQELKALESSCSLIYGACDTATPPMLVQEVLKNTPSKHLLTVIEGGGHDLANSHTQELVKAIQIAMSGA
jgi:pimeloyl-ACP methyl ester carboxylesterase